MADKIDQEFKKKVLAQAEEWKKQKIAEGWTHKDFCDALVVFLETGARELEEGSNETRSDT